VGYYYDKETGKPTLRAYQSVLRGCGMAEELARLERERDENDDHFTATAERLSNLADAIEETCEKKDPPEEFKDSLPVIRVVELIDEYERVLRVLAEKSLNWCDMEHGSGECYWSTPFGCVPKENSLSKEEAADWVLIQANKAS